MVGSIDVVSPTSPNSQVEDAALARRADAWLVAGMMRHAARHATLVGWCRVLHRAQTFASDGLIDTLYLLISRRAWGHVHAALRHLNTKLSDRSPSVVATAIGLGTRIPVAEQWAETLGSEIQALAYGAREVFNLEWKTERLAALAFVWAWVDRAKVPQNLASELGALAQLDRDRFNPSAPGLVRCAAVLGHVWSKIASKGIEKARDVIDVASLRKVLRTLLASADDQDTYNHHDVTCALLEATMAVSSELGGDADRAVGEALSECAQQALGGAIGEATWRHLLRRGAPHRLLADWCEMWIGEHGYAWQRRAHDRMKEARRFVALATLLGEQGLVIRARNSMLLGVSSFQFRKDDLLGYALAWMQLALEQGADWATPHAAQLLGLSRAADAVGEDTLGLEVESTVNRCFAGSGPQALLGLWKASPVGTWLVPEATDLFFGLVEAAQKDELDHNAIRPIWCLAVGSLPMQRSTSRAILSDLYAALSQIDVDFGQWAARATPAEAAAQTEPNSVRLPYLRVDQTPGGVGLDAVEEIVAAAENVSDVWAPLAICIAATRDRSPTELDDVVQAALDFLKAHPRGSPWWHDGRQHVYWELAGCDLGFDHWWSVAEAILSQATPDDFQLRTVCENLENVCRCAARGRAGYDARQGLERQLSRVMALADVPTGILTLPQLGQSSATSISWPRLSMLFLTDRFETDDSVGIASAIRGLSLLLDTYPDLLPDYDELIGTLAPRAQCWAGYVLEWLASRHPLAVHNECGKRLASWLVGDHVLLAVQAWATLSTCARLGAGSLPDWPKVGDSPESTLVVVGRGLSASS